MSTPEGFTAEEAVNPICLDIYGRGIMLDELFAEMPSPMKEHSLDLVHLADIVSSLRGETDYEKWAELHARKMALTHKIVSAAGYTGETVLAIAEKLSTYDETIYPRKITK